MADQIIKSELWESIPKESKDSEVISRPSMTYWQDAWRRLKKSKLSMLGLAFIIFMTLIAIFGPYIISHDYSTQELTLANIPPKIEIYKVSDNSYFYMHSEYKLFEVTSDGKLGDKIKEAQNNLNERNRVYNIDGHEVILDYSFASKSEAENPDNVKYKIFIDGKEASVADKVRNKVYVLGTDGLGRDVLAEFCTVREFLYSSH